ncbi:hypothetical protein HDU93_001609 [Gonapodya sp. JEL0774]|nr:hypothetical protein HDU93_001609 [Gonapodya sp. JEL0774]
MGTGPGPGDGGEGFGDARANSGNKDYFMIAVVAVLALAAGFSSTRVWPVGGQDSGLLQSDPANTTSEAPMVTDDTPPTPLQPHSPDLVIAYHPHANASLLAPFLHSLVFACPRLAADSRVTHRIHTYTPRGWHSNSFSARAIGDWMDSISEMELDESGVVVLRGQLPPQSIPHSSTSSLYPGLVLISDAADTVFQRDPFDHPLVEWVRRMQELGKDVVVFGREGDALVRDDPEAKSALLTCHPNATAAASLLTYPLSPPSVILGTWSGVRAYLGWMRAAMAGGKAAQFRKNEDGGYECRSMAGEATALHTILLSHFLPTNVSQSIPLPIPFSYPITPHLPFQYSHPVLLSHFHPPLIRHPSGSGEIAYPVNRTTVPNPLKGAVVGTVVGWRSHRGVREEVLRWWGVGE